MKFSPAILVSAMLTAWLAGCGDAAAPAATAATAGSGLEEVGDPVPRDGAMARGVVVSCYRWGPGEWDGPDMPPLLDELKILGVTAMQIHPYAGIARDGTVNYRRGPVTPATLLPNQWAGQRGMTTFLKPHLAYWGSGFPWRGEITFGDETQWQRFFRGYTDFIVHQAELAEQAGVDKFAVGTELRKTLHREADWRDVIAAVRGVYTGDLTYAANWDEVQDVPFWDALDLLGVQCYFPLSDKRSPTEAELIAGWAQVMDQLRGFSAAHGKPVLLAELGYAESEAAAIEPWSDTRVGDRDAGAALKLRCMKVALDQIEAQPWITGVYLWKWFPGDRDHRDEFVLQYDAMRDVIRGAWGTPEVALSENAAGETAQR
ncbi:MAG: hypothetical protein AAF333_01795 [Planctomycetota bacterium]